MHPFKEPFDKHNNIRGTNVNPMLPEGEDALPSLSDWHDYEPNLEFDDTELHPTVSEENSSRMFDNVDEDFMAGDLTTVTYDIEETLEADNYEEQLSQLQIDELNAMTIYSKLKFIDYFGTDKQGQHIFAIYACRLPNRKDLNGTYFIEYIIRQMEPYVQNDYVIAYFHQGLKEDNKPSIQFLWNAYKDLDRNFRKNLKKLYVIHPTLIIKVIWNFFKPFISEKFKSKLIYISNLEELRCALGLNSLKLPENIYELDDKINKNVRQKSAESVDNSEERSKLPTCQFGVTLKFINENSPCLNYIPPIVRKCVDCLALTGVIDTEGLFRRSGNYALVNELKKRVNDGEDIDLKDVDPHVIASLLKSFLRDLSEPLLTYELYDYIVHFLEWPKDERSRNVKQMLREKLPVENYELLKYLTEFLVKVMECKDLNKMTSSNLAIVFGPNLVWAKHNQMSLDEIGPINAFFDFVLLNHKDIYLVDINKKEVI